MNLRYAECNSQKHTRHDTPGMLFQKVLELVKEYVEWPM